MEAERPDVVVTDIRMPPSGDGEGIAFANRLRETHPEIGVVVVSQYADPRYGLALLDRGSDRRAYLLKDRLRDREHLIAAIYEVAAGGSVVDAKVVEALIAARAASERSALDELTRRELEILGHMAQGKSNQAIAEELFLSKRAVEKHINAIFMKLGLAHQEDISRRVKAALIYLAGLVARCRSSLARRHGARPWLIRHRPRPSHASAMALMTTSSRRERLRMASERSRLPAAAIIPFA